MKWIAALLLAARMFFDESIPCLGLDDNCGETQSPIKDDEIYSPYEGDMCPSFDYDELPEELGEDNLTA
jgi:hypothetical protein